ncbi:hypothetical protein GCM10009601_45440 [Streptomyces thermospinosisporus]|uniref:Uncharacterized protein n=1 Tax=Streptomyces thermospinosisporus TaxID=161482 RepID=A0ABP4JVU9_9ACTN
MDGQYGAGPAKETQVIRIALVVMLVGCALTAWFLLRGYRQKDD